MEPTALGAAALMGLGAVRPALVTPAQLIKVEAALGSAPQCADDLGEALRLCFRVRESTPGGETRERWLVAADLTAWGVADVASVRAYVAEQVRARLGSVLTRVPLVGMNGAYWLGADEDGWAPGVVLVPDALVARAGFGPLRVAAPSWGVVLVWTASDPALELAMAVGVREMFASQATPLTDLVFAWEEGRWLPYGRAAVTP
jgi:hypothetical protein